MLSGQVLYILLFLFPGTSVLLFCALALAAAKPREQVELNAAGCPVDSEITKFLSHENCHQFYQCVDGSPVVHICPADLLFNTELNICDWPLNVDCDGRIIPEDRPETGGSDEEEKPGGHGHSDPSLAPEICAAEDSEGVLVAHENCNEFYVCEGRRPVAIQCPDNLFYNPENEQCDWPRNVECGERVIPAPAKDDIQAENQVIVVQPILIPSDAMTACAQDDSEGVLVAHENCNRFYKCSGGKPVALDCPASLVYNINAQYCDWVSNVECGERTIAEDKEELENNNENDGAWMPEHGHSDPSQAPAICAAEGSDSVLVAHENCSQFYKCYRGVPVAINCPANLFYHPELEICDWPQNVDCAGRNKITVVNH